MRLLVVGDTHGNPLWWDNVVEPLAGEVDADGIIQVGDFGYWGGADGMFFLDRVRNSPVPVWFIDGNHEAHSMLTRDVTDARQDLHGTSDTDPVNLGGSLWYLPRGGRIEFDGVTFACCGGAVSIDRGQRTAGIDWFLEEQITDADVAVVAAGGHADVLLSHDAPSGWTIPGLLPDWDLPRAWRQQRPACEEHRSRVREVMEAVTPSLVVHGHYHVRYQTVSEETWGPVQIEGLNCDGTDSAFLVLDCHDGHIEVKNLHISLV
jgi:predicted phosphodiesterase